jgi:hypothetical protein
VYIPSLMLIALHEERVRDFDRRAAHADLRSPQAGRAQPWPTRALAAASGRSHAGARTAGLATARARS